MPLNKETKPNYSKRKQVVTSKRKTVVWFWVKGKGLFLNTFIKKKETDKKVSQRLCEERQQQRDRQTDTRGMGWLTDFNSMPTCLGLFYALLLRIAFIVRLYLHFFTYFFIMFFAYCFMSFSVSIKY